MIDSCGRKIDYLRVSVTDRCNLRCRYCMPEDGIEITEHSQLLSLNEILKVCQAGAQLGIHKIKLTGGEPLIRRNLEFLVRELKATEGIDNVTLTTNGTLLEEKGEALAQAGIDAINVSLDTLNPQVFREITRKDDLDRVLKGIEYMKQFSQVQLKLNCVPFGLEGQNIQDLAKFAKHDNIHVRFIEMMPIGLGKEYKCMKEEDVVALLESYYGTLTPYSGNRLGNGPCHYYEIEGFTGKVGFISAISHKFCDQCNRVRLTSLGFLKNCLQYEYGGDLKAMIRQGCSQQELAQRMEEIIYQKPQGHRFNQGGIVNENDHMMSQIGG